VTLWCHLCRLWMVVFQWNCLRECWCEHSWGCMGVTLMVMVTAVLTRPAVLRLERIPPCPRFAPTGIGLCLVCQNPPQVNNLNFSWRSWSNVSTCTFVSLVTHLYMYLRPKWLWHAPTSDTCTGGLQVMWLSQRKIKTLRIFNFWYFLKASHS